MGDKLDSILKKVFLSALAGIGASNAPLANENTTKVDLIIGDNKVQSFSRKSNDLSPKLILKRTSDNDVSFFAHRSHRSHSSHRSHYSSSSGSSSSPSSSPKSTWTSPPSTQPSPQSVPKTTSSSGLQLSSGPSATLHLGDRTLKLGMSGTDVTELVNILLKKNYLKKDDGGTQVTGIFLYDGTIEDAVKKFQKDNALTIDGICNTTTIYYLKNN